MINSDRESATEGYREAEVFPAHQGAPGASERRMLVALSAIRAGTKQNQLRLRWYVYNWLFLIFFIFSE